MSDDLFTQAAQAIVAADREAAEAIASEALEAGISPAEIMAKGFVAGIGEVGELFESGELFLPKLMMSAQPMEGAMSICNAALGEGGVAKKAHIVIGSVQGDVHDIGKAIVIASQTLLVTVASRFRDAHKGRQRRVRWRQSSRCQRRFSFDGCAT